MFIVIGSYDITRDRRDVSKIFETEAEAMEEINRLILNNRCAGLPVSLFKHVESYVLGDVPKNKVPLKIKKDD